MRALIVGAGGQDASYLAEYLLTLDAEVTGIVRRNSIAEHQTSRIDHLRDRMRTVYGDVTDRQSLVATMKLCEPDEVYNLAAQSHVGISFKLPELTVQTNAVGAMNVFLACREVVPKAHIYQASSSEMFGSSVDPDDSQRETTPMWPTSPYGCAKLFAYSMARHLRRADDMWIANGILFNHGGPRRARNFVEAKIVRGALDIAAGRATELRLGNLNPRRDWGAAKDYVQAMHAILAHTKPDDFVIATGITRSVRDVCNYVFAQLGLDYRQYVKTAPEYIRPQELPFLRGDATKAKEVLGWQPALSFEDMIQEMLETWK